jgi:hypothetical protein
MTIKAHNVKDYLDHLPLERAKIIQTLIAVFEDNLPPGFELEIRYNMPTFVVPKTLYPKGYHVDKTQPLPFISIASQKHHIAIYHSGLYMDQTLLEWFKKTYESKYNRRLDMGKSCLRFKKETEIPYDMLTELASRISPKDFIQMYEDVVKK